MANIAHYDPAECTVIVNGVYLTDMGEDMIDCSKDSDDFETDIGAQGDVVITETHDARGTVKVTLHATSPQIPMLKSLRNAGSIVPVWVMNKSLGTKVGGTSARIKKPAGQKQGKKADDLEYEFQVFDYTDN